MASSSVIGALRVNLGLDSAQFQKGIRQSQTDMQRFAAKAKTAAIAAVGAFSAVAGGLGVMTAATARTAKELERFSQVANATPEEFQRWSAASKDVGIEQEKLSDILKDVNDRVGDFLTTGGGPMADFFENIAPRVGVTADQFKRLSGPEALQLYVDTLQRAGASQQEMTFYLEAMASDATALIPILKNGGEELKRLGDNAASLGAVMGGSAVASLAAFDVSLQNVSLAMTGVKNRISAELAPAFTALADSFVDAMREGGALRVMIDGLIENISLIASTAAAFTAFMAVRWVGAMALATAGTISLAGAINLLRAAIVKTGFGALIVGAGLLLDGFGKLVRAAGGFGNAMSLLKDLAVEVFQRIGIASEIVPAALKVGSAAMAATFSFHLTEMAIKFARFTQSVAEGMNSLFGTSLQGISVESGFVGDMQDADAAMQGIVTNTGGALREIAARASAPLKSLQAIRDVMSQTADSAGGASIAVDEVSNSLSSLDGVGGGGSGGGAGALKEATEDADKLENKFSELKQTMESAFVGLLNGANSLRDTIKNLLSSFADMALSSAFQMIWDGGGQAGSGGGILGLLGIAGARADGGPVGGGRTYLVGERGPELFTPGTSGGITPNHELGQGMGNVTFAPVINAQGADAAAVARIEAIMQQQQAEFASNVIKTVQKAKKSRMIS